MKFIIAKETLLPALQDVVGVVERRPSLPILSNLLLNLSPEGIRLTTTDMEVELVVTIAGEFEQTGDITLPARKLFDICRALPDEADLSFSIESGRASIVSGKSRFTLATLPAQEFPQIELLDADAKFTIQQDVFKSLLAKTAFAMAQQDVRYYLNGLLLEAQQDKLRAVATDGHRLALCDVDVALPVDEIKQLIVPRKGVLELTRLLQDSETEMQVQMSRNHIRVDLGRLVFTSKLIDGKFPDYTRVVPEQGETPVLVKQAALRQGLSRASILSSDKYRGVRITLEKDKLRALVHNQEQEEAEEEIDVEYAGDAMEVGFNVSYLLDAVSIIQTEALRITISTPKSGCLLLPGEGTECRYVVMPLLL